MDPFEGSPDAERHGGISILQGLVAYEWRRLLRPQTRLSRARSAIRAMSTEHQQRHAVYPRRFMEVADAIQQGQFDSSNVGETVSGFYLVRPFRLIRSLEDLWSLIDKFKPVSPDLK
jgi:hypothetical protein